MPGTWALLVAPTTLEPNDTREWVGTEINAAMEDPIDRAILAAFVEMVHDHPGGMVADLGCGPGRVAACLASGGIKVVGIDVSGQMLTAASTAHPGLPLPQATIGALPFRDGSLKAVVSWYSIVHAPLGCSIACGASFGGWWRSRVTY